MTNFMGTYLLKCVKFYIKHIHLIQLLMDYSMCKYAHIDYLGQEGRVGREEGW